MQRTAGLLRSVAMCVAVAAAGSGCGAPDPDFAALGETLAFGIADARASERSGVIDFGFTLRNRGESAAVACVGEGRSVSVRSGATAGTSSTFTDHPSCTREFSIEPGDTMSWRETLEVPHSPADRGEIAVEIQIVNPRRCNDGGGCPAFTLTSNVIVIDPVSP